MSDDSNFMDKLRGSFTRAKVKSNGSKDLVMDAVFELPKDEASLFSFLKKHGKDNYLTLFVEGKDVRMKSISAKLRFLGVLNNVIYCLSKTRSGIKILGVTTNDKVFNSTHEDILAKNIGVSIEKPRPPYTITNSLKDLIKWAQKVSVPSSGKYTLRLFLRGTYLEQRHYLQGIFASSEKGALSIEKQKKSFFSKIKDIAILPITIPLKIVELVGREMLKFFIKDAESGVFFVNIERASFSYNAQFISAGDSKNAMFKPDLYIAELSKVS